MQEDDECQQQQEDQDGQHIFVGQQALQRRYSLGLAQGLASSFCSRGFTPGHSSLMIEK